jgi:hypothetical protein
MTPLRQISGYTFQQIESKEREREREKINGKIKPFVKLSGRDNEIRFNWKVWNLIDNISRQFKKAKKKKKNTEIQIRNLDWQEQ